MAEFVDDVADDLVASGIGGRYANPVSGVSIQVNLRRKLSDMQLSSGITVVLLTQVGGLPFPRSEKEQQGFQVLVDAPTVALARDTARAVYDQLNERTAECIGSYMVMWLRGTTTPQAIPTGPSDTRVQFSINFNAELVLA